MDILNKAFLRGCQGDVCVCVCVGWGGLMNLVGGDLKEGIPRPKGVCFWMILVAARPVMTPFININVFVPLFSQST